jgi:cytochrome P450
MTGYDPFEPAIQLDPYATYTALQRDDPVHFNDRGRFWTLTRFADVWTAVHDPATYSSAQGIFVGQAEMDMTKLFLPMLIMMDPPRHTKLRAIVSRAFTPRHIAELEPTVRGLARQLLEPALEHDAFDLVETLAGPLPTFVIADLLGVPRSDHADFRTWSDQLVSGDPFSEELAGTSLAGAASLYEYFAAIIAERRRAPQADLVTSLIQADVDGEQLSDDELLGFCLLLLVAGNETTTNLISNAAVALAEHPDQCAALARDGAPLAGAVEEFLRYDSPVQGLARTLTRDVELHGRTMHEGDKVMLLFGAANRDPEEFGPTADQFDVRRNISRHLAFGHGIHYCLGASLARLEARAAYGELLSLIPHLELADRPERRRSGPIRGMVRVPLVNTTAHVRAR